MENFWEKTPHTVRVCYFHFNRGFPNDFKLLTRNS